MWVGPVFQLLTEVFKLVNNEVSIRHLREIVKLKEEIDNEMSKPILERDMDKVDRAELRLVRIAGIAAVEIARSNALHSS